MSTKPEPKVDPELVPVFDTQQESEAMVVQGMLESAGIEALVSNLGADQALWPGVGGVVVLVNPHEADEAKRIIEEERQTAETDEEDVSEP